MVQHKNSLLIMIISFYLGYLALFIHTNLFFPKNQLLVFLVLSIALLFIVCNFFNKTVTQSLRLEQAVTDLKEENRSLNKELNKAIFEILALFEFTNIFGGHEDYHQMLKVMVDTIKRIIKYDGCCLFLCDNSQQQLNIAVSREFPCEITSIRIAVKDFFVKEIFQTGQAVLIENILDEPNRFSEKMPARSFGDLRSFIAVPMIIQNNIIGILTIAKKETAGFSHDDIRLLFIIGNEAALAIQNRHLYEQVYYSSITDGLTGLFNQKYFSEQIGNLFQKARFQNFKLSLALMDIDNFKMINDTYGHLTGDYVLKQIAIILRASLPEEYFVARYGGEEFAILMPKVDLETALQYSECIRHNVEVFSFNSDEGNPFNITVSLGVACYPEHISEGDRLTEELIHLADEYLYSAKNSGRNRVCTNIPEDTISKNGVV